MPPNAKSAGSKVTPTTTSPPVPGKDLTNNGENVPRTGNLPKAIPQSSNGSSAPLAEKDSTVRTGATRDTPPNAEESNGAPKLSRRQRQRQKKKAAKAAAQSDSSEEKATNQPPRSTQPGPNRMTDSKNDPTKPALADTEKAADTSSQPKPSRRQRQRMKKEKFAKEAEESGKVPSEPASDSKQTPAEADKKPPQVQTPVKAKQANGSPKKTNAMPLQPAATLEEAIAKHDKSISKPENTTATESKQTHGQTNNNVQANAVENAGDETEKMSKSKARKLRRKRFKQAQEEGTENNTSESAMAAPTKESSATPEVKKAVPVPASSVVKGKPMENKKEQPKAKSSKTPVAKNQKDLATEKPKPAASASKATTQAVTVAKPIKENTVVKTTSPDAISPPETHTATVSASAKADSVTHLESDASGDTPAKSDTVEKSISVPPQTNGRTSDKVAVKENVTKVAKPQGTHAKAALDATEAERVPDETLAVAASVATKEPNKSATPHNHVEVSRAIPDTKAPTPEAISPVKTMGENNPSSKLPAVSKGESTAETSKRNATIYADDNTKTKADDCSCEQCTIM